MSNNQLLLQFLIAYIKWLHTGARGVEFKRNTGLCSNLRRYFDYSKEEVLIHMCNLFEAQGLDRTYPFNEFPFQFSDEVLSSTVHLNPKRIHWVQTQIEKLQHEHPVPGYPETN